MSMDFPPRDKVVCDPAKELFWSNSRLTEAHKIIADQNRAIATLISDLRQIMTICEDREPALAMVLIRSVAEEGANKAIGRPQMDLIADGRKEQ